MNQLNPIFSIIIFILAFITSYFIVRINTNIVEVRKYETIDSLRGFLAISVFIHHSAIWYGYIQTGEWVAPDSNFYNQLGQTAVCLFFMITGFLFFNRIIDAGKINWKQFFISRALRLVPMYYFSLAIIITTIIIVSHGKMNVTILDLSRSISEWLIFGITGIPNINAIEYTQIINAGIAWTLPFEWLFYFSMPIWGLLFLKEKPSLIYIILALIFIGIIVYSRNEGSLHHIISFAGGFIASLLLKHSKLNKKAESVLFSLIIIVCLILIGQFKTVEPIVCKIIIAIMFTCIALGNTFLGILKSSTIKFLGDISYSTYLLHGICLFYVFHFGFGMETAKNLSPIQFWVVVCCITPILVVINFFTFKYIEKPAMEFSKKLFTK